MSNLDQLKKEADDAQCKIEEIVKECKDKEGANLGLALGSSLATELGFALSDVKEAPKNVYVDIGIGITHAWRWVTHGQTLQAIDDALQPSCETQVKDAIQELENAKSRWEEEKANVEKMKKEYDDMMDARKKLRIDSWDEYKGSLNQYEGQKKITIAAMKEYCDAAGLMTIYSPPQAKVYDKDGFEKIWDAGIQEFKKVLAAE